ncbi:proline-rich protein 2-like [Lontra canadensis]|uniref:proline-rich protein 2-like n=1 Tax=Lontra canadensis TaxID=76717 RepID=UPI0013F38B23|nr:proline-rich protein 2-like [Lontra canadensis]
MQPHRYDPECEEPVRKATHSAVLLVSRSWKVNSGTEKMSSCGWRYRNKKGKHPVPRGSFAPHPQQTPLQRPLSVPREPGSGSLHGPAVNTGPCGAHGLSVERPDRLLHYADSLARSRSTRGRREPAAPPRDSPSPALPQTQASRRSPPCQGTRETAVQPPPPLGPVRTPELLPLLTDMVSPASTAPSGFPAPPAPSGPQSRPGCGGQLSALTTRTPRLPHSPHSLAAAQGPSACPVLPLPLVSRAGFIPGGVRVALWLEGLTRGFSSGQGLRVAGPGPAAGFPLSARGRRSLRPAPPRPRMRARALAPERRVIAGTGRQTSAPRLPPRRATPRRGAHQLLAPARVTGTTWTVTVLAAAPPPDDARAPLGSPSPESGGPPASSVAAPP